MCGHGPVSLSPPTPHLTGSHHAVPGACSLSSMSSRDPPHFPTEASKKKKKKKKKKEKEKEAKRMPLTRYRIKNEYGLADPETYRSADKDDPEALLEGVAMAGLVGLLRQLGDLAEFAAEIFHDLHEEVMATAARGHGLTVRIQQLEAEFPPIEKALLLQTNHSLYYSNPGIEWHPNLQMEQNLITRGDLPRFVMDSYEESRGPPRLFLLDKFDVAGAGACLKRYSDPSFLKVETVSDSLPTMEVQREKKVRKTKKKGSRWRNGETPETVPAPHAKLHQLFMEERIENAYNDPARRVKLKRRPLNESPFDSKKSYMEKFVETPSPESKTICEVSVVPLSLKWTEDDTSEPGLEVMEVSTFSPVKDMSHTNDRDDLSPKIPRKQFMDDVKDIEPTINRETDEVSSTSHAAVEEKKLMVNGDGSMDGYHSDEMTSEVENYMDALAAIESEMETDNDNRPKHSRTVLNVAKSGTDSDANEDVELQTVTFGFQSVGNSASDDGNSSYERNSSSLCTDGGSSMGYSSQFDGDRFLRVFPPHENTITDSRNLPDDQPSRNKEAFGMESKEFTVSTATCIGEDAICDYREASQTSPSANLESMCMPLDTGSRSPVGSEQDETSANHIKRAPGLSDSDEPRGNHVDSTAASDDVPNQTEWDNLATVSTKSLPVDELESRHFRVCSMDAEHPSNNLELTSESESRNEMPNAGDLAESSDGIMPRMESSQSRLSLEEQHQFSPRAGEDGFADRTFSSASFSRDLDDEQASAIGDEVTGAMLAPVVDLEKSMVSAEERRIHVEDQKLLDEVVIEGNLSDLDLQHEGGDHETSCTLDSEEIDSCTSNVVADGRELAASSHLAIPHAESDVCSNSGDPMLPRVGSGESAVLVDESEVLVEDQQFQGEMEKLTLHKENLSEVDIQKEERSSEEITLDGENTESLSCNVEAVVGVTVPLAPSDSDNSVLDDLVTREVQEVGVDTSQASLADIGGVPQERADLFEAESPSGMKESGVEGTVNEVDVAHADLDSVSAADWDPMAHGDNSTAMGASGSSPSVQTQTGFSHDIRAPPVDLELENSDHVLLRMEDATAASEGSSKLTVVEPTVDSHLADDDTPKSLKFYTERVLSMDHSDHQETAFLSNSEAVLEYKSGLLEQVTEATQLPDYKDEEARSTNQLNQEKQEGSLAKMLENFSIQQPSLIESLQGPVFDTGVHNFGLLSEGGEVNLSEMPPMPPLPPVEWRMGKALNVPSTPERKFPQFDFGHFPSLQPSLADENPQIGFPTFGAGTQLSHHNPFLSSPMGLESENPGLSNAYATQMPPVESASSVLSNNMEVKPSPGSLWSEQTSGEPFEQYSLLSDTKLIQVSPSSPSVREDITSKQHHGSPAAELAQPQDQSLPETHTEVKDLQNINENADGQDCSDPTKTMQEQHNSLNSEEERMGSTDPWASPPTNEGGKSNGTLIGNIPRPPKPLIEAVAAHDRSKLRKVAERVRPQLAQKLEERDSLLEQIRTKSFNLKPATATRTSIQQAPKTNLKALAGSDEDDDADSWSE
ncbi:hypothetical protein CDL15_Pgr007699 [Punica granatum]|uniref:Protein SCAR n=1 Tax=Punica granatum TaxID=22663 RepID=A0A218XAY6_PUNGR|nr:hypothetical protein CDL15_Pgr007699 [Punica granatum]